MAGATAALQLVPLPAFMTDEHGHLIACNELFSSSVGVPASLLLGREWGEAFSAKSIGDARTATKAIVSGGAQRASVALGLTTGDGSAVRLAMTWHRVSEPGTRRALWIFAVTSWEASTSESTRDTVPTEAMPVSVTSELSANELAAVTANELLALTDVVEGPDQAARALSETRSLAKRLEAHAHPHAEVVHSVTINAVVREALDGLADEQHDTVVRLNATATGQVRRGTPDPRRPVALTIANALRRTPPKEGIDVRTYDAPGRVCVEVRDSGMALTPSDLAAAHGTVLGKALSTSAPSTLATARGLARVLGGTLRATQAGAQGLVVVIELPLASPVI